ncbi:MAG: hypothetical protein ACRCUE_12370 [Bosea sp. (in: a-proteobacteria)]
MAQYATPTVVIPALPVDCLNEVERFILTSVFQHQLWEGSLHLFAEEGIDDEAFVCRDTLDAVLDRIEPGTHRLAMLLSAQTMERSQAKDPQPLICFINELEPARVLQGIVRRHPDHVPHVVIQQAFTCSTMCPDGFGGAATVIHAGGIEHICTTVWARQRVEALEAERHLIDGRV